MSVKISELPVLAPEDVAAGDVVAIVDSSEGVTKQVDLINAVSSFQANRNAIINGNFAVNQRGVSGTVTLAAGDYGHDRWKAGASGCTYTFATVENVTTLTITAGSLVQVIEGINLFTGTYILSWTGTAQGKIGAGSFGASGITESATGGTNLSIEFNTGTVAQVQLEPGSVATPFERRTVGTELALCQRYYCVVEAHGRFHADAGARTFFYPVFWPQEMRTDPTTSSSGGLTGNATSIAIEAGSPTSARLVFTSVSTGSTLVTERLVAADAEL